MGKNNEKSVVYRGICEQRYHKIKLSGDFLYIHVRVDRCWVVDKLNFIKKLLIIEF